MKIKGKVPAMVLMVMGLVVMAGCAGQTESATFIGEVVINASAAEVWDYLCSDPLPKPASPWLKEVTNERGKRCTVGYSEDQTYQAMGQTSKVRSVAIEVVPNHRLVYKAEGDISSTATYVLVPEGDSTRLILVQELTGQLPSGMGLGAVKDEISRTQDITLRNIREGVEK